MTTDSVSINLSKNAYLVDRIEADKQSKIVYKRGIKIAGTNFVVIDTADTLTGMQAMAVAKLDNTGNIDYSHISIAFAGTNPSDWRDLVSDGVTVVSGVNGISQANDALSFAKRIQKEYPKANVDVHGHSLGGYNALYVGAKLKVPVTAWNAPNPNNILSEKEEQWLRDNLDKVVNFKERNDAISYGGGVTSDEHDEGIYEPYNVYIDQGYEEQDIIKKVGGEPHKLSNWEKYMNAEGYLVDKYGTPYRYNRQRQNGFVGEPAGLAKMLHNNQTGTKLGRTFGTVIGGELGGTAGLAIGFAIGGPLGATVGLVAGEAIGMWLGNIGGGLLGAWFEQAFSNPYQDYMAQYSSVGTGRVRDFSERVKDELLGLVKEVEEESVFDISKWDIFYRCERLLGKSANFQLNAQTLNNYYRKSIDIDGTTRQQVHAIFEKVYQLDREYGLHLQSVNERLQHIAIKLQSLADSIEV